MPLISLVVCLHREKNFLARVLQESDGLFDNLIVVHDGPEEEGSAPARSITTSWAMDYSHLPRNASFPSDYTTSLRPQEGSIHELTLRYGGEFFEGPRCYQQEPHWPFAWSRAQHDWILRLDADEFPSDPLKSWLRAFRKMTSAPEFIAGYTCIWPIWDGQRQLTQRWPAGRHFLINRRRVRFFGMVEQTPVPSAGTKFEPIPLILEHRPNRISFGATNLLARPQAFHWRRVIAESLKGKPTDLPRWNWSDESWPLVWQQIRRNPLLTAIRRLLIWPLRTFVQMRQTEGHALVGPIVSGGLHHFLIALTYWRCRCSRK